MIALTQLQLLLLMLALPSLQPIIPCCLVHAQGRTCQTNDAAIAQMPVNFNQGRTALLAQVERQLLNQPWP